MKKSDISRQWYIVDASSQPLGRLASQVASYLIGKHKTTFTPHIDNGDYIIVTNAAKLVVTGRKLQDKTYYRHSGYVGGIKQTSLEDKLEQNPTSVIELAVRGMLPKNKLLKARLARLKVYVGTDHEHDAQKPKPLPVKGGSR